MNSLVKSFGIIRHPYCISRQIACSMPFKHPVYFAKSPSGDSPPSHFNTPASNLSVEILKSYGVINPEILKKVSTMPVVLRSEPHAWRNIMDTLLTLGCDATVVANMVLAYPNLLKMSPKQIQRAWEDWLGCLHQTVTVRELIVAHPVLLSLNKSEILSKFNHLKAVIGANKFVADLLIKCPHIMFQSQSELENVSDYISMTMVVRNASEYYKSVALGCTLEEVMTRHVFLERCGKYRTPNLKQSESVPTGNPSLSEIYDSPEEEFATKVAGVTLEEYVVFERMFEDEMKQMKEDEDSDFESSDSDEE